MWEQIKFNRRKTLLVWLLSGLFFLLIGFILLVIFGDKIEHEYGITRFAAVVLFFGIWFLLSIISYFWGDTLLIKLSEAKKVDREVNPRLFNVIQEMKLAANLPVVPDVYIMPSLASNAFATGIKMENSSIIVTAGLLSKLNREELQAVIAHETAHILNRDILMLTFLGNLIGAFYIVVGLILLGGAGLGVAGSGKSGSRSRRRRKRNIKKVSRLGSSISSRSGYARWRTGGTGHQGDLELDIDVGLPGKFFYSLLSKTREHLADASAARLTRNPAALASALEKIDIEKNRLTEANAVTAPMFIEAPLKDDSTHPPIKQRINILREMTMGASYTDYQQAYQKITGQSSSIIPKTALEKDKNKKIECKKFDREQDQEGHEELKKYKKDNFYDCRCGVRVRVPSDYEEEKCACPRCGRVFDAEVDNSEAGFNTRHFKAINFVKGKDELPEAEINQLEQDKEGNFYYQLKEDSKWESFLCQCKNLITLSPGYRGAVKKCKECGISIKIKRNEGEKKQASLPERIGLDENGFGFVVKGDSWQRFSCFCGGLLRLSPNFVGRHLTCGECGRKIKVRKASSQKNVSDKQRDERKAERKNRQKTIDQKETEASKSSNKSGEKKNSVNENIEGSDLQLENEQLVYRKTGEGWESFTCVCENIVNLSPAFALDSIKCNQCDREIKIKE